VHSVHVQVPVLQQLQQSHCGQKAAGLPTPAGTMPVRPSAAQSKKLFMGKYPFDVEPESIHPRHDV
jgi:hypothetical protein